MAHTSDILDELADVPSVAHRRRDRLAAAQVWLPLLVVAVVAVWWLAAWWLRGDVRYTPGPLSIVHASWDQQCAACHVGAQPLGGAHWTSTVANFANAADTQCQTCHAGPPHHRNEIPNEAPSCTVCHREHRGRDADPKRVANERCTACHQDLSRHVRVGEKTEFLDVTRFAAGAHPEFRLLREAAKDPGKVAFNHKLHLAEGLREQANASALFTLADIPKEQRERYRGPGAGDNDPVKLDCVVCHRNDSGAAGGAALPRSLAEPPRPMGASMLPITYEQHCQACHPLTFTIKDKNAKQPSADASPMRHRLQPDEVKAWLRGYFTERLVTDSLPLLEQPARPLPGKNPQRDALTKKLGDELNRNLAAAERILFGPSTCGKCHPTLQPGQLGQRLEPANIPSLWHKHARFDHASHRGVACQTCHAGVESSRSQADVLLPGINVCLQCHAPAGASNGPFTSGARHDCVECHRYHDGDHPWRGRGGSSAPKR